MLKKFDSVHYFLFKVNMFSFSLDTNCAKIDGVRRLETDFQQVSLVQIFWNFHSVVVKHQ